MKIKKLFLSVFCSVLVSACTVISVVSCSQNIKSYKPYSLLSLNKHLISTAALSPSDKKTAPWQNALNTWTNTFDNLIKNDGFKPIISNDLNHYFSYVSNAVNAYQKPIFGIWFDDQYTSWAFLMHYEYSDFQYTLSNNEISSLSYIQTIQYTLIPVKKINKNQYQNDRYFKEQIVKNIYQNPYQYLNTNQEIKNFVYTTEKVQITEASVKPILVNVFQNQSNANNEDYYAYGAWTINDARSLIFSKLNINYTSKQASWNKLEKTFNSQFVTQYIQTSPPSIGGNSKFTFHNQMQRTYEITELNENTYNQYSSYFAFDHNSQLDVIKDAINNRPKITIPKSKLPKKTYTFNIIPNIQSFNYANTNQDMVVPCTWNNGYYYGTFAKNKKMLKIKEVFFYDHFIKSDLYALSDIANSIGGIKNAKENYNQ